LRAAAGNQEIILGWDANSEPDLAGYRVYSSTNGAGPFALQATAPIARYLNTLLTNGTIYYYYVTAFDVGNNESGPSNTASAQPYDITPYTYTTNVTCNGATVVNCNDAGGAPNNGVADISGAGELVLDFGAGRGIIDGTGPDMVFYEYWVTAPQPGILLDYTFIDLSADGTTWYRVFAWDGIAGGVVGTNIDSYATDGNGESENEQIPASSLYGSPFQSGITIDIGVWTPPGYSYRYVRFTYPSGGAQSAQVDAVERLN
jgi:hypothetical protein